MQGHRVELNTSLRFMKTIPVCFAFSCDTVTLVEVYRRAASRPFVSPRLNRVLRSIEIELALRGAHALHSVSL